MLLMISVVNPEEVEAAVAGGADILDVKNPAEGSLGAQTPHTLQQVRAMAPAGLKVSAALGDLPYLPGTAALAALGAAACGVDFVKIGLYGPKTHEEALTLVEVVGQAVRGFPGLQVIAAGYADAGRAGTLDPRRLPEIARLAGAAGCLLDTAIKDGRHLFDFMTPEELRSLANKAHASGLLFALAGALQAEHLPLVRDIGADIVGIRSAACRDSRRDGPLDPQRIKRLRQIATAGRQTIQAG